MSISDAIWLFDLGNTRLKGACLRDGELTLPFALEWEDADAPPRSNFETELRERLRQWPASQRVLIASVVSCVRADRLRIALEACPQASIEWLRSPRQGCGIVNRYRVSERLGIDRFLAMAAARAASNNASAIVIGCGTTLTLDAVDANGAQQEGLIAPSPRLMLRSLRAATAIDEGNPDAFAREENDDTARALRAGCMHAAAALIERYCDDNLAALGDASLWLHGGGAHELRACLRGEAAARARILDDAVLRGLSLWALAKDVR